MAGNGIERPTASEGRVMMGTVHIAKEVLRWVLAAFFVLGGVNHFLRPRFYEAMVPPYLPSPHVLVVVSGVAEIVLGVLLVIPPTSKLAALGLIALLIAVFPANIQMALHPESFRQFSPPALWLRLPLQFVLMGWAAWYAR
jgi:uncharacterized membrane protein